MVIFHQIHRIVKTTFQATHTPQTHLQAPVFLPNHQMVMRPLDLERDFWTWSFHLVKPLIIHEHQHFNSIQLSHSVALHSKSGNIRSANQKTPHLSRFIYHKLWVYSVIPLHVNSDRAQQDAWLVPVRILLHYSHSDIISLQYHLVQHPILFYILLHCLFTAYHSTHHHTLNLILSFICIIM